VHLGGLPENIAVLTLTRVPWATFLSRAHVPPMILSASLWLGALAHCHNRDRAEKLVGGSGAIPAAEGSATGPCVDVSYAALQAHEIVYVALHREYSTCIVFTFSQGSYDPYHV
jgi:hypothetical protein